MTNRFPKKILYLDNSFTFGGAIISLCYLLRGIDKRRYRPVVVTSQPEDTIKKYFNGLTTFNTKIKLKWHNNSVYSLVISLSFSKIKIVKKIIEMIRFSYWMMFVYLPEAYVYYKIGKKYNINLVHLNNIMGSQLSGIMAAKLLRVPCVAHLQDFERVSMSTRFYARLIDHHIAISNSIKENLLELGVAPEKITVVYHAIDLCEFNVNCDVKALKDEFAIVNGQPLFGIFGRIINWKGTKEFVNAASLVFKKVPQARAFVVGDVSDGDEGYLDDVKRLAKKIGISDKIVFTGYREDVAGLMKLMNVIVLASITPEPFGMVVIEAMAMGKPVVATMAGGPLDSVVDGETGYLFPIKNNEQMARAILRLLENPRLAGEMGRKGRKRVEKIFCKERYANQVEKVYVSLLDGNLKV